MALVALIHPVIATPILPRRFAFMEWPLLLLFILGGLILLLCIGVPVAFAFTFVNILGALVFWGGQIGLGQLILSIYDSVTKFTLLPIVMFIYCFS